MFALRLTSCLLILLAIATHCLAQDAPWLRGDALRSFEDLPVLEIRIEGNASTRDEAVLRELGVFPSEAFKLERLRADLRFLEGLGLFLTTDARARREGEGLLLVLELEERSRASNELIYPTLEFDEDMRFKAGLTFRNRNLRGMREDLGISRTMGWEDSIVFRLTRPWFGSFPLEHSVSYSFRELDAEDVSDFRDENLSISLMLPLDRRHPREHRFVLGGGMGWRRQEDEGDIWNERLHRLLLGYSHDGRDSYFRPRGGSRFDLLLTLHHPRLESTRSLRRWLLAVSHYHSLDAAGVLAGRLELSIQQGDLYHRGAFSLGGLHSVRAWGPGHFSGWEGHDQIGGAQGRNRLVTQMEWRRTLFGQQRWKLTRAWTLDFEGEVLLFLDAGLLWREGSPFREEVAGDRALGFGGGFRIYSPVGDVLRVELGFNPEGGTFIHVGNALPF